MSYIPPTNYSLVRGENDALDPETNHGIALQHVQSNPLNPPSSTKSTPSQPRTTQPTGGSDTPISLPATQPRSQSLRERLHPRRAPLDTGKWSDGIFDWPSNLYPSCFCACCVFDGVYLIAQMAQKTGFSSFKNIIYCYIFACLFGLLMQLLFGFLYVWLIPLCFSLAVSVLLRLHMVRKYGITDAPCCGECCCGFCCWYCSVAQMARHVYGYSKVLDGDGDPERPDSYPPVPQRLEV